MSTVPLNKVQTGREVRSILLKIKLKIELDLRQQKVSWKVSDAHCAWYTFDDKLKAGKGKKDLD